MSEYRNPAVYRCKNVRCGAGLTESERATGKGKCIFCLIKGYQWVLKQKEKELEQQAAEIHGLRKKLLGKE
jgi:radical SAM superfamily enzyme